MTKIIYRGLTFMDSREDIISVKGALHQSMIADSLSADECTVIVRFYPAGLGYYVNDPDTESGFFGTAQGEVYMVQSATDEQIAEAMDLFEDGFETAQPLDIYEDDVLFKRFYVTEALPITINQDKSVLIQFKAVSFIGLTVFMAHNGGIYSNSTVGAVIAEILKATKNTAKSTTSLYWYDMTGGLHYTMDATVANTRADGHLPITDKSRSARDNIRDVCVAYGVSVHQQTDGSVYFTFSQPDMPTLVEDLSIYKGDRYSSRENISEVRVIANTYQQYADEDPQVLWESAQVVSHSKVIFDDPCWGLYSSKDGSGTDTITIEESGANYAIISGTGTLYGIPYLHTQEEFSQVIGSGVERVRTCDSGMVTLLNYQYVLDRMANYFGNAREISAAIKVSPGTSTGSLLRLSDPLGRIKTGIVSEMDFEFSSFVKGACKIVTNWQPSHVGNNFNATSTLTGSGTWSKASAEAALGYEITSLRIDLISAGDGGAAGEDGEAGTVRAGGAGGAAGSGGLGGKVRTLVFEEGSVPTSFTYTCAQASQPGAAGGITSVTINGTVYTSETGTRPTAGYMNIIDGSIIAEPGPDGVAGGDGGTFVDADSRLEAAVGKSVTYKGRTWTAGDVGGADYVARYNPYQKNGRWWFDTDNPIDVYGAPGSSGGAAFGASSQDATSGSISGIYKGTAVNVGGSWTCGVSRTYSGASTNGANALPIDDYTPSLGSGGAGGNGGGGGGSKNDSAGAGGYQQVSGNYQSLSSYSNGPGTAGAGGSGSAGTSGGPGGIVLYTN